MKEREREKVSSLRLCVCERMCVGVNTAGSEVQRGEGEKRMKISSKAEYGEDDKQSVHSEGPCASVHSQQGSEKGGWDGHARLNVCIKGTMTSSPVAGRTRSHLEGQFTPRTERIFAPSDQLGAAFNMPLVLGNQGTKYQPWSHSDMTAVLAKLPPITSGGGRWLSKLMALCHGTTLAVGDLRCLLGQIFTASQMRDFEVNAGIEDTGNAEGYTTVCTMVGEALRKQFPTPPTTYQNIKFRIKPGETGSGYYFRCAAEWEQMVEENSLNNPITRDIFRSAVMSGAPNGVKQAMEGNPDIPVATNEVWERHLVFHIDRTVDKLHKDEEELEKTKNQLLKLQLDLARASGPKKTKQMSQQSVNDPPTPSVIPPYFRYDQGPTYPTPWSQRGNWGGNRGQRGGNMGFRGRRGRGGEQQRGGCFLCGGNDHWKNECPSQQGGGQFTGPPAGGWGPLRGGPGGRGRGPHASRYSGQQHRSPQGVIVTFPDGTQVDCSQTALTGCRQSVLLGGPLKEAADIYWVELDISPSPMSVVTLYNNHRPWIMDIDVYLPPIDPLHCTLFYDRNDTVMYQDMFNSIEGDRWRLTGDGIFIGKEGVVAPIVLTSEQLKWYEMTDTAAPHISMALHPGHEARELGGMTKRLRDVADWEPTDINMVLYSHTANSYWVTEKN